MNDEVRSRGLIGAAPLLGEQTVTLLDVIVLDKDPAEEDTPTVLFPAKDLER